MILTTPTPRVKVVSLCEVWAPSQFAYSSSSSSSSSSSPSSSSTASKVMLTLLPVASLTACSARSPWSFYRKLRREGRMEGVRLAVGMAAVARATREFDRRTWGRICQARGPLTHAYSHDTVCAVLVHSGRSLYPPTSPRDPTLLTSPSSPLPLMSPTPVP